MVSRGSVKRRRVLVILIAGMVCVATAERLSAVWASRVLWGAVGTQRLEAAYLAAVSGDLTRAEEALRSALASGRRAGSPPVCSTALRNLAGLRSYQGRHREALRLGADALATAEKAGDAVLAAKALVVLTEIGSELPEGQQSADAVLRAASTLSRCGLWEWAMRAEEAAAHSYALRGEYAYAYHHFQEAAAYAYKHHALLGAAYSMLSAGLAAARLGRVGDAERSWEQARDVAAGLGGPPARFIRVWAGAELAGLRGDLATQEALFGQAMGLAIDHGWTEHAAGVRARLGAISR